MLHFLPAEHSRTDTQHFTGVHVDELGKVIGEDFAVSLHQQPVPGKPAKFQLLAQAGQRGDATPPGVHVQFQQAFFHPPLATDRVYHIDTVGAGNGNGLGEMVVSIQREGVFCYLAVFPAVDLSLVPLVGKVDPAQPVCHDATMVFGAPSIFRQGPVFHILTGAPVGEFNPCGIGGIAHPEGVSHPPERMGRPLVSDGRRLKKIKCTGVFAKQHLSDLPACRGSGGGIHSGLIRIGEVPELVQALGAGHFWRAAAQICHTAVFPFLRMAAFPFSRCKVSCQRVEEIIVLILEYVFLARHQLPRVLLLGMVAPFSSLLFHQVTILPLLFAVAFPSAAFFRWNQDKQILVLLVQVIQRPAESGQLLSQRSHAHFVG